MARQTLVLTGLLALLLGGTVRANAQLSFTFAPDMQTGAPGDTLTFSGTLTNNSGSTLFLNSDTPNLIGMGLTLDDSLFFANAPTSLNPGDTTGIIGLFTVAIDSATPFATYPGSFSIVGGSDASAQDLLATSSFTVVVAPAAPPPAPSVPEPGSTAVMGLACSLIGIGFACRSRVRKTV